MLQQHTKPNIWLMRHGLDLFSSNQHWKEEDLQNILAEKYAKEGYHVQSEVWCQSKHGWGRADLILRKGNELVIVEVKKYLDRESIYQASMQSIMYAQNLPGRGYSKPRIEVIGFVAPNQEENAYKTARFVQDYTHPNVKELKVTFIDCDPSMTNVIEPGWDYFLRKFIPSRFNIKLPNIPIGLLFRKNWGKGTPQSRNRRKRKSSTPRFNFNWIRTMKTGDVIIILALLFGLSLLFVDEKAEENLKPIFEDGKPAIVN